MVPLPASRTAFSGRTLQRWMRRDRSSKGPGNQLKSMKTNSYVTSKLSETPVGGSCDYGIYLCICHRILEAIMRRTAKIFMNNRSQAVRLPKEFQFNTSEVFIRKQGNDVILSARPTDWAAYLASGPIASQEFMEGVEDLPTQEREP